MTTRRSSPLVAVASVLVALIAPACGSTVQGSAGSASGPRESFTDQSGQSTGAEGLDATVGASQGGAGAAASPAARAVTGAATGNAPGPGATAGRLPQAGRGFDARHIYVGVPTAKDSVAVGRSLGVKNLNWGDQEAVVNAVVADINKRGGLFGRTIVPVFHDNRMADLAGNPQLAGQENCVAFTEDRPVVAVVNVIISLEATEAFVQCLAQHKTPLFSSSSLLTDDAFQRQFEPYLYRLTVPSFNRVLPVWLSRLAALGYFTAWDTASGAPGGTGPVKVGLLYGGEQPGPRIWQSLKTQLAAKGYDVAAEFAYDSSSVQAVATSTPQAVLPFRGAGVTHVLSDRSSAFVVFARAAENQRYRPRYGLQSVHYLGRFVQTEAPAAQLAGSLGIGWVPSSDVDQQRDPGVGAGQAACRDVLTRAGAWPADRVEQSPAYEQCDGINLAVQAALAGEGLDAGAVRTGVARLGPTFQSALVFRSGWSAARSDQPAAIRDIGWDDRCACFTYLSQQNVPL